VRINHVLVDFESVQPASLALLEGEQFSVHLFVGASQNKVPFDLASALQRLGARGNYVKISGNGPNALDFHIAFYVGRIATTDSSAFFHIVSRDKGFDPLIKHLKTLSIFADRVEAIDDIPIVKAAMSKSPEQRMAIVVEKLRSMKAQPPPTLKGLKGTISALFHKQLSEDGIDAVVRALTERGLVVISGRNVTYALAGDG
jgi:hypothetical protein